jgi:hypothetical protein
MTFLKTTMPGRGLSGTVMIGFHLLRDQTGVCSTIVKKGAVGDVIHLNQQKDIDRRNRLRRPTLRA